MKTITPRSSIGKRENGKFSSDFKPFNQKALTLIEIKTYRRLWNKMQKAYKKFHADGKCKIENEAIWPCSVKFFFESGMVHHFPNGHYY
ncbi:MAG: hypothetical protein ACREBR_04655 [bacterium]